MPKFWKFPIVALPVIGLVGCVAGPAGLAIAGLSLLGDVIMGGNGPDGSPRLMIDPNKDLSDELARADSAVNPQCKSYLDRIKANAARPQPELKPGECRTTLVCLGGMSHPLSMSVCAPGERDLIAQTRATPRAAIGAGGRDSWTWTEDD
ncbi:MAG: hypothetical protein AAGE80_05195 [Pseudomonadota bacterium]